VALPASSFAYSSDLAGTLAGVTVDGTAVLTDTYDAAGKSHAHTYNGDATVYTVGLGKAVGTPGETLAGEGAPQDMPPFLDKGPEATTRQAAMGRRNTVTAGWD